MTVEVWDCGAEPLPPPGCGDVWEAGDRSISRRAYPSRKGFRLTVALVESMRDIANLSAASSVAWAPAATSLRTVPGSEDKYSYHALVTTLTCTRGSSRDGRRSGWSVCCSANRLSSVCSSSWYLISADNDCLLPWLLRADQVLLGKKGTRRPPAREEHWQRWTSQFP
jgi:hypothetical protein